MSDWEDDPNQTPVDPETWKYSQEPNTNDDDGDGDDGDYGNAGNDGNDNGEEGNDDAWGEDNGALTWAQEDGGVQLRSGRSNRFDDDLWGGGGGNNRPNNSYGRGGRGRGRPNFQDRNNRYNDRQRSNDTGFGYDNSRDNRYQNGYGAKKSYSGNSRGNYGSTNGWGNSDSDGWAQNGGGRSASGSGCYKCGEDGHFARECSDSTSSFQSKGRPGGGRYIPKEVDDFEELYKNSISSGINFDRYGDIPCEVSGYDAPEPVNSFVESGLKDLLMKNIERSGYTKPTPVQKYALSIVMKGRDLMGCAQTGSGKTAAFLLPVLNNLLEEGFETRRDELPQLPEAIIVAPTRELAIQIKDQSRKFANNSPLKSVCIYGGTSVPHQINQIKQGVNVLVATPGRLLDFLDKGFISFRNIKFFVLDEADRMLDMGFMPDIERMESHATMPRKGKRQTLMFSATFPDAIQRAASNFLDNYLFLKIGLIGSANSDVTQSIFRCHKFEKRETLLSIFKDLQKIEKTLIFVQQKKMTDFLASYLCQNEVMSITIHGDRLQEEREEALYQFSRGKMPVLVATDCAARGLDIPDVAHVINYDLPKSMDEYVHRIGRTGRVGNMGRASSFYDPEEDAQMAANLVKVLVESKQEVPDWLQKEGDRLSMAGSYGGFGGYSGKDIRQKNKYESSLGQQFATQPSEPLEEDELWE